MIITDKINKDLKKLPESSQVEVLDFIEFLLKKKERESLERENKRWSKMSLSLAMRGMEDEDQPNYTLDDIKEDI